jgi:hypothetical protein
MVPEVDIGYGEGRGDQRLAEVDKLVGEEVDRGDNGEDEEHGEERWKDAANSSFVEAKHGEARGGDVAEEDGR